MTTLPKKKTYDEKLDQANKLLADQREKDRADKKNRLQEDYLINLQRQIDQKKRELEERNDSTSKIPSDASNNEITEQKLSELPSPEKTVAVEKKTKPPIIDRSTKPSISIMDDTDQDDIRKLLIPFKKTSDLFKEISQTNTEKNIETCGILCGVLKKDHLKVSHIVVPKQSGTSDSCRSTNEEDVSNVLEKHNLITLGWIHTHPTQRSFLSSIDLHTHALYQKMLSESIAIVIAPSYDETSIFSMTEIGLDYILKCPESGFHPHTNEQSLYDQASHCVIDESLPIEIIDLR